MITIRKSVRNEVVSIIPTLTQNAVNWMQAKYPDINFNNVEFIFSAGYSRSRYFRNEAMNAKYINPNVCISTRALLMLYNKPSLGIKKNKLFVGSSVQMMCSLIHELTHHVQYERNIRKGNELDTTANELEYLKQYHPNYYGKLVATK
jgi:hypothetical protein